MNGKELFAQLKTEATARYGHICQVIKANQEAKDKDGNPKPKPNSAWSKAGVKLFNHWETKKYWEGWLKCIEHIEKGIPLAPPKPKATLNTLLDRIKELEAKLADKETPE